jgi:DnaA family protein
MHFSPQLPFDFSVSEKFTFSNFLVSGKNAELVSLLKNAVTNDEHLTFIWGNPGVGKSHLLQAICHENEVTDAREGKVSEDAQEGKKPAEPLHCLYLPMQKIKMFGPEVFNSLHHMDVICMDDFDCVIGDKDWEESLFEFFNRSRNEGVKLLVTAKNSPRGLSFTLPDLASRMSWGVIYQLFELNDEEKLSALDGRARGKHMPMSSEVLQYIFMRHSRDLQSLLSVLDKLDQLSLAEKRRLTIPFIKQVMAW